MTDDQATTTFLTTKDYATLTGRKPQTVRIERLKGHGPRYIRVGNPKTGLVLYRLSDVLEWLEARTFKSTAEETVAAEKAEREAA